MSRLERASADTCTLYGGWLRETRCVIEASGCRRASKDRAVAALVSPTLNALYRERSILLPSAR